MSRSDRALVSLAALCGAAWMATLVLARPTRGRDWRGYEGKVTLLPTVVYRFTLEAPFDTDPSRDMTTVESQALFREALEATGARNLRFYLGDRGVRVDFDQSFGEARLLDFDAIAAGTFRPVLARRLDGREWSTP